MNDTLPITIEASDELAEQFGKLPSVINKLAAQFNFQTLTAGWYGDENNILLIDLGLTTPTGFCEQKSQQAQWLEFADDVCCYRDEALNRLNCIIAITDSELALLHQQEKLLDGFMRVKLHKVLNLIATEQQLLPI